jgi:hypothetical protein
MSILFFAALIAVAAMCFAAAITFAYDCGHAAAHREIDKQLARAEEECVR